MWELISRIVDLLRVDQVGVDLMRVDLVCAHQISNGKKKIITFVACLS